MVFELVVARRAKDGEMCCEMGLMLTNKRKDFPCLAQLHLLHSSCLRVTKYQTREYFSTTVIEVPYYLLALG